MKGLDVGQTSLARVDKEVSGRGTGRLTLCYPTSREAFSLVCYAIATLTNSIAHDK